MNRFLLFIKINWIAITAATIVAITVLSLLPPVALPEAPGNDKVQHCIAYAFLIMPAALRKPRRWQVLCLLFVAYSGIIELVQPFVNRTCDWRDLLANAFGVTFGLIAAGLLNSFLSRRESR
jgi:hypothetical protein